MNAVAIDWQGKSATLNFLRDITERKQTEEALRENEEKFKAVFEGSHDAITLTAENGKVIDCNQSFLKLFGLDSKEDFGNKRPADFSPPLQADGRESQETSRRYIKQVIESGKPKRFEWLHQRTTGEIIPTEIILTSYPLKDKTILQASIRDITERKQVDEALRQSEERFRQVVENIREVFWLKDLHTGRILYISPAYENIWGRSIEEMYQKGPSFMENVHPEDKERILVSHRALYEENRPLDEEYRVVRPDQSIRWVRARCYPVFNKSGKMERYAGIAEDITEHKHAEAEREKLQQQLVQAQKMESVGRLAGGVAHDFNNMLGVILGRTELMLLGMKPGDPRFADLEEIQKAARRSADLTRQLLAFARKQTIAPKVLDLNDTVEGMLKILRRLIGEDIDLLWKPDADLWPVKMDPAQVDQILANLCVNARDAIAGTGKVTIGTENTVLDEAYCADHAGFVPGEYVMLAVSDDGCGMDKETQSHLFEPFFTTKEAGKGTGLGLATVYGIAKQNNGFVNVYSEPGKGTTFKVYIPRYEGDLDREKTSGPGKNPKGHGETVLLVEDDPGILTMGKAMLEQLGHAVLTAGDPDQALKIAKTHAGSIHLLMTDVIMPQMSGREMAEQIKALRPEIRILFMSGYTADVIAHRGILDEEVNFIQKPFSMKDLAAKVREALEDK